MTWMGLQYLVHVETVRSNLVREGETQRHNVATEGLGWAELGETKRSNLERERVNRGSLTELVRSNKVKEAQNARGLAEIERSNRARESISRFSEIEKKRSNLAQEGISLQAVRETARHNVASEILSAGQLSVTKGTLEQTKVRDQISADNTRYKTNLEALAKTNPVAGSGAAAMDIAHKGQNKGWDSSRGMAMSGSTFGLKLVDPLVKAIGGAVSKGVLK